MSKALGGIRVIDLTTGPAGGLTTMMLADFGAEVIRIVRRDSAQSSAADPLETLPAAPMWHRGKLSLALDLNDAAELDQLIELCRAADVLVCNWRPQSLQAKHLDPEQLKVSHPHLVFCHITGYGHQGPLADLPGYEHAAAALTGRMQLFQGLTERTGPVFSALQVGIHACAQSAVSGILAALYARHTDGKNGSGCTVRTSLLQGLLAYEQGAMLGEQFAQTHPDSVPSAPPLPAEPPMPSLYYHPAQAGDGTWMQFGNLLPHLFDNFLVATDLIDIVADPEFNATQMLLPPEKHEAFRERMLTQIASQPAATWMEQLIANGQVVAGVYQTTQQALSDPDIVANGHALKRDDGVQLGPVARLTETKATPGPALCPDTQLADLWLQSPRSATAAQKNTQLPLTGIKVLEIATIIAAPFGASLLADLGAEVTKVEQIGGDPYRGMLAGVGSARVNAGKRSICVNLKSAEGKQIVLELARHADILIHNYRPGVPERLGIGYDAVKSINPGIIYLQSNGYGPDGPGAQRPSTHPIPGAALGGVLYQLGERVPDTPQSMANLRLWTRRLMRANEVNPDPNTAVVVATSALLGLVARTTTGTGQRILVDMFSANAYANHDDFLSYPNKAPRAQPDDMLQGLNPTYRLYKCADERWVFLAMTRSSEHQRFVAALEHKQIQQQEKTGTPLPTFSAAQLKTNTLELGEQLEQLFLLCPAAEWESLFVEHQVACLQADASVPHQYWLTGDQAAQMQLTQPAEHPAWGKYHRHGPMVTFDNCSPAKGAAPLAGEHSNELLAECGYSAKDIATLRKNQTVWSERATAPNNK